MFILRLLRRTTRKTIILAILRLKMNTRRATLTRRVNTTTNINLRSLHANYRLFLRLFRLRRYNNLLNLTLHNRLSNLNHFNNIRTNDPKSTTYNLRNLINTNTRNKDNLAKQRLIMTIPNLNNNRLRLRTTFIRLLIRIRHNNTGSLNRNITSDVRAINRLLRDIRLPNRIKNNSNNHRHIDNVRHMRRARRRGTHRQQGRIRRHNGNKVSSLSRRRNARTPRRQRLGASVTTSIRKLINMIPPPNTMRLVRHPSTRRLRNAKRSSTTRVRRRRIVFRQYRRRRRRSRTRTMSETSQTIRRTPIRRLTNNNNNVRRLSTPTRAKMSRRGHGSVVGQRTTSYHVRRGQRKSASDRFYLQAVLCSSPNSGWKRTRIM